MIKTRQRLPADFKPRRLYRIGRLMEKDGRMEIRVVQISEETSHHEITELFSKSGPSELFPGPEQIRTAYLDRLVIHSTRKADSFTMHLRRICNTEALIYFAQPAGASNEWAKILNNQGFEFRSSFKNRHGVLYNIYKMRPIYCCGSGL